MSGVAPENDFKSIVSRHERQFRTVGDMVYAVIRESIVNGVIAPGEWLRQDQLAEQIGVSRIPVRSALIQLETEGLITFHPYRGAIVNRLTVDEMRENYELRTLLESHALRKAIPAMTPERLAPLEQLAAELNQVESGEDFLTLRTAFYRELYDGARRPQLVRMIEKLRNDAGRYWLQRHIAYVNRPGERDHMDLLPFVRSGDVEGAVSWLEQHLARVCDRLVSLMGPDHPEEA
jgi:DNA-binding GntR family transcriptional regulator